MLWNMIFSGHRSDVFKTSATLARPTNRRWADVVVPTSPRPFFNHWGNVELLSGELIWAWYSCWLPLLAALTTYNIRVIRFNEACLSAKFMLGNWNQGEMIALYILNIIVPSVEQHRVYCPIKYANLRQMALFQEKPHAHRCPRYPRKTNTIVPIISSASNFISLVL